MHIKVSNILNDEVGASTSFKIGNERPRLDDLNLDGGVEGDVIVTRLEDSLVAKGTVKLAVMLECHRCLRTYSQALRVPLEGEFSQGPSEDQWPISSDLTIDLAPLLRQEAILKLPIKQICSSDCPGLCEDCGKFLDKPHHHPQAKRQKIKFKLKEEN